MIKNIKIGLKLNLLLGAILLAIVVVSSLALASILGTYAEKIIADKALLTMETMNSVRQYTSIQIQPELSSRLETEELFLPQTVPAYSAIEVFEYLRQNEEYNQYFYKEAVLNPTNPRDQADLFETEIIQSFRQKVDPTNTKMSDVQNYGFRSISGEKMFYIARPLVIREESCLRCHSTPENAPRSQIKTYGDRGGFGWQLNEIIGAQMIFVPASKVIEEAQNMRWIVISIVLAFLLIGVMLLNMFLKFIITNPINKISFLSNKLSMGDFNVEFKHKDNDEIGILSRSLNRLKISLEMAMDMIENKSSE